MDQAWYEADEEQGVVDDVGDLFASYENQEIAQQEQAMKKMLEDEKLKRKRLAQPVSQRQLRSADHDKWELNRMYIGGAVGGGVSGLREEVLEDDMDEERVHLMVHDIKPPFLDGRQIFTKQQKPICIVKDPTSDFVKLSKKGSAIVK